MAAIKSQGNMSTEIKIANLLRSANLKGWRRHYSLPGTPDFCWPKERIAVFVDGCFWHGGPLCHKIPKSNVTYWKNKLASNRSHDRRVNRQLKRRGWVVLRIKECQLSKTATIFRISRAIQTSRVMDQL
jgi:DNA mismatch endonuclease (patch repair protein)